MFEPEETPYQHEQESSVEQEALQSRKRIRKAAMNYLARREHAFDELQTKLEQKFKNDDAISAANIAQQLQGLQNEGLQSNLRFTESYVHSRYVNGYGPERIALELQQKGIDESQASQVLYSGDYDWQASLIQLFEKKYPTPQTLSFEEKLKCQRYLAYRGFAREPINSLGLEIH
jgi:regulatory protein